jgi:hypothetical protein
MAQLTYQVGTGTDALSMRANDGGLRSPGGADSACSLVASSAANQLLQAGGGDSLAAGSGDFQLLQAGAAAMTHSSAKLGPATVSMAEPAAAKV